MFSKVGQLIFERGAVAKTSNFKMGLEIEMQRVDDTGQLSQEPYPAAIGDEKTNPWITNDYLETMSEVVTPAARHSLDAMHYLYAINNVLRSALAPGELLWPLSMPPQLPADKRQLQFAKMGPAKEAYLKEWTKRHGYSEGTPCGTHINLSISDEVIELVQQALGDHFPSRLAVQNYLYTVVAQGFMRYRWLITYLFGASPLAEANYFAPGQALPHPIRSIRQSHYGFGTKFRGAYTSVADYVARIEAGVKEGILISDYEFHGAVRFKGNQVLTQLPQTGVQYLELRMLDLDPSSSVGIRTDTLRFIRLLASYFIMTPPLKGDEVDRVLAAADAMNEVVATEEPTAPTKYQHKARAMMQSLERFANQLQLGPEYQEILEDLADRVENPKTTPSAKLLNYVQDDSLTAYALRRAKRYQAAAQTAIRQFPGFDDDHPMTAAELTQALFHGNWEPDLDH